jgi:hypothetical protein
MLNESILSPLSGSEGESSLGTSDQLLTSHGDLVSGVAYEARFGKDQIRGDSLRSHGRLDPFTVNA